MRNSWQSIFGSLALGLVASVSAAQQGWDEPALYGSYQPVTQQNVHASAGPQHPNGPAQRPVPHLPPSPAPKANSQPWVEPYQQAVPYQHPAPQHQAAQYPVGQPYAGGHAAYGSQFNGGCDGPQIQGYPLAGNANQGCGSGVGQSYTQQGFVGNAGYGNCQGQAYSGGGYAGGGVDCGAASYDDFCGAGQGGRLRGSRRGGNWIVGANALVFFRDYEDDRGLGFNSLGEYLFSTDSSSRTMGGVEAMLGRRNCSGWGWEARYWGLYPNQSNLAFANTPYSSLGGLSQVYHVPSGFDVLQIFNTATVHRLYRENDFTNVEVNVLRNGGQFGNCGRNTFEVFGGARWFQFDETLRYSAFSSNPAYPAQFNYDTSVANQLLGSQFGGRIERCLSSRLRWAGGVGLGLFNNRITQSQRMFDQGTGSNANINAGPFNGRPYDYTSTKSDIAMLGEINTGIYYQLSQNWRFNLGYRMIGVSGVALAPDQIPYNFTDANEIQRIDSNGSLILHGLVAGVQACF